MADLCGSVSSSLTTVCGLPHVAIRPVGSRSTRAPDSDVSATTTKTLPHVVIDNAHNPEAPTGIQAVKDDHERSALVRNIWRLQRPERGRDAIAASTATRVAECGAASRGCARCPLAPASNPAGEIDAGETLLPAHTPVSPHRPFIQPRRLVTDCIGANTNQSKAPSLAHFVVLPGMSHGLLFGAGRYHCFASNRSTPLFRALPASAASSTKCYPPRGTAVAGPRQNPPSQALTSARKNSAS